MNGNILDRVKEFIIKLVKDRTFQHQLQNSSVDEQMNLLQQNGYSFSKTEFETAAIALLEQKEKGLFQEITETELVAVLGGCGGFEPPKPHCMHGPVVGGDLPATGITPGSPLLRR